MDFAQFLQEKLIVLNGGAKYGQVVFMAGGGGSGKGFAISTFMEGDKFKVRDVDAWKVAFLKLNDLKHEYPELDGLDLRTPGDVFKLHMFVKQHNIKNKTLDLLFANADSQSEKMTLPNVLFDVTLKDIGDITEVLPKLLAIGYKPENIHLIWVLTNYSVAVKNNAERSRVVPDDILLQTHEGAASTMYKVIMGEVPRGLNGRISVILNNRELTILYPQSGNVPSGKKVLNVKDFTYIDVKKPGKPMEPLNDFNKHVLDWIEENIPKTKGTEHMFRSSSINQ
jgi:hypothetical protein